MDVRTHIAQRIEHAKKYYVNDLQASSHEFLSKSPGGKARSVYDFTFEVVQVNEMIATRLSDDGSAKPNLPDEGWATAPEEFRNKETCVAEFTRTMDSVLAAWNALPEDQLTVVHEGENGEWSYLGLASLIATHAMYHDAQINYLQAIDGDEEVHWN